MSKHNPKPADAIRLDATAWTDAALEMLAIEGIDGVRVELLAKRLGVTKGSFYWHFKDRDALYNSMLLVWRRRATLNLIERLDRDMKSPELRLRRLLRISLAGPRATRAAEVELAIRMWGRRDERARLALQEVDQLRISYMAGLMRLCGVPDEEVEARSVLGYSYVRVAASLVSGRNTALLIQCENVLLRKSRCEPPPDFG